MRFQSKEGPLRNIGTEVLDDFEPHLPGGVGIGPPRVEIAHDYLADKRLDAQRENLAKVAFATGARQRRRPGGQNEQYPSPNHSSTLSRNPRRISAGLPRSLRGS